MDTLIIKSGEITGPTHSLVGENSQDSLAYYQNDDYTIIAVADGAGSLKRSKEGSEYCVKKAIEVSQKTLDALLLMKHDNHHINNMNDENIIVEDTINELMLEKILTEIRDGLMSQEDYKSMGCTLAFSVILHDSLTYGIAVVGDAFSIVRNNNEYVLHTCINPSEYANITELITSKTINPHYFVGEGFDAICASSDGLVHSSIYQEKPVPGFWDAVINRSLKDDLDLNEFFQYMDSKEKIDDDCSLIIVGKNLGE